MNIQDLKQLNGWQRGGIATSLLWSIIATTTYCMSLGVHYGKERTLADVLPGVVLAWRGLGFSLFEIEIAYASIASITPLGFAVGFDVVGFLAYVLIPIAAIWVCGYFVAWVAAGFLKR